MSLLRRLAPGLLSEDADEKRRAEIIRSVCFSFAGVAAAWTVAAFLLMPPSGSPLGLAAGVSLAILGTIARRHPGPVANALVALIWLAAGAAVVQRGGSMASAIGPYVLSIGAAGILLGVRAAVVVAVASALVSAGLIGLAARGLLPLQPAPLTNWGLWAVAVAIMAATPVLLWVALGRIQGALRDAEQSEHRYRLVADNARDLIWLMQDGRLRYVSPASQALLGLSPEEMLERGADMQYLTPDSAQLMRADLDQALSQGKSSVRFEGEHVRKDGSTLWCEVEVTFLRSPEGRVTGMLGVTRDMSQRRMSELERERLQLQLLQAQKTELVGRISAGVAHDLNNQLTVILGALDDLQARLADGDPSLEFVAEAREASHSAAALTRQLLIFSRQHVTQRVALDLAELLRRLERTLRRVVGADIELMLELDAAPAIVLADTAQLEQVVINLVMNARDAMPRGGRLTLALASAQAHGGVAEAVLLRVTDTGSGIDPATRSHLFEPFFTTKPPGRGTGLGLSIVRRIIEEAGGAVRVDSEIGRGTSFEVELPRYAAGAAEPEQHREPSAPVKPGASILVVDDVAEVRRLLARALERAGYHALEAPSASHALAVARAHPGIDLLVTDVVMPGMRGPELVKQLRDLQPALPVLYVTGYAEDDLDFAPNGLSAILVKPFPTKALLERVRELLGRTAP